MPHERGPAAAYVTVEAQRLVLREDEDAAEVAVQTVRKGEVDDPVDTAERHCGFGAVARERPKPLALATGEKYTKRIAHQWHLCVYLRNARATGAYSSSMPARSQEGR